MEAYRPLWGRSVSDQKNHRLLSTCLPSIFGGLGIDKLPSGRLLKNTMCMELKYKRHPHKKSKSASSFRFVASSHRNATSTATDRQTLGGQSFSYDKELSSSFSHIFASNEDGVP